MSKASSHVGNARVVRSPINEFVEFIVQRPEILIPVSDAFLATCIEHFQSLLFQGCHADGTQSCTEPFKLGEGLEHVVKLLNVNQGNRDALSWRDLNEAGSAQSTQGFADRSPRHAKLSANARLVKSGAGLDGTGQYVLDEGLEDFVGQRHGRSPVKRWRKGSRINAGAFHESKGSTFGPFSCRFTRRKLLQPYRVTEEVFRYLNGVECLTRIRKTDIVCDC